MHVISQTKDFLEDVRKRVEEKLGYISAISEDDIEKIVKGAGYMPLPFLKKFAEGDLMCEQCGTCCQKCTPIVLTRREIKTIARYLNTSPSKLKRRYNITHTGPEDLWQISGKPCPFLKGINKCTIYPVRMHACRNFPLKRMYFQGVTGKRVEVSPFCPIVREAMARFYSSELISKKFRGGR